MNLDNIFQDWDSGLTHRQIKEKHKLTAAQEFLIAQAFDRGFGNSTIENALPLIQPGMSGQELIGLLT